MCCFVKYPGFIPHTQKQQPLFAKYVMTLEMTSMLFHWQPLGTINSPGWSSLWPAKSKSWIPRIHFGTSQQRSYLRNCKATHYLWSLVSSCIGLKDSLLMAIEPVHVIARKLNYDIPAL